MVSNENNLAGEINTSTVLSHQDLAVGCRALLSARLHVWTVVLCWSSGETTQSFFERPPRPPS